MIVSEAPTGPEVGFKLVMVGPGFVTVNRMPFVGKNAVPTVTVTLPVVAPFGTETTTLVLLQLVGVPTIPLKVTVLTF